MKFFKICLVIALFSCMNAFSQKVIKHKIKSGESIYGLALKYDVTEKEIYALNPKAKGALLQLNQVISVPNKKFKEKEKPAKKDKKEVLVEKKEKQEKVLELVPKTEIVSKNNEEFITHLVTAKETLYSLSKQYGVTMEAICEMNPELKISNLKKGAKLKLPNPNKTESVDKGNDSNDTASEINEETKIDNFVSNVDVIHKVLPKETLFRISKNFGVSVSELQRLNPGIENGLPIGYDLVVKKGSIATTSVQPESSTTSVEATNEVVEAKAVPAGNLAKADFLISKASQHIGTRYRSGGTTSAGFDCSGLMFSTFKNIDMTLPRSSHEMAQYGVRIDKSQAQKGDLIFFATFGGKRVSHVGMITEVNDGEIKFIHSSTTGGVMISSVNENYYARTFVQINRVIKE